MNQPAFVGPDADTPNADQIFSFEGVPHWLTVWTWLYTLTPAEAASYAKAIAAAGYTGVQLNLLDGSLVAANVNGERLLPTSDPAALNPAFLEDSFPLIQSLLNRGLTVVLNLVWGTHIASISTSAPRLFTAANAAKFAAAVAGWVNETWPSSGRFVFSLMADSHPVVRNSAGLIETATTITRVDVLSGGTGYAVTDTVQFEGGQVMGVLEVENDTIIGCRVTKNSNVTALPKISVLSGGGRGAVLVASDALDWRSIVDAMGASLRAALARRHPITVHAAVPVAGTTTLYDGSDIVQQGLADYYETAPAWADLTLLQSGHSRSRPRASAYEVMYARAAKSPLPFLDAENGYLEIPAALPADVTAVALSAKDAVTTIADSKRFRVVFAKPHGLKTPTDSGRHAWIYPIGVSSTGGLTLNGLNHPVVAIVSDTVLECEHPFAKASGSATGGGTTGTVRLRREYLAGDRLPGAHVRARAWQQLILGAFGHCESAEGIYNATGSIARNDKYLPQIPFLDRLSQLTEVGCRTAVAFFRQRPLALRVPQQLVVGNVGGFVRVYGTRATFRLGDWTGAPQNLGANLVVGCVARDRSFACVYSTNGQAFDLNLRAHLDPGSPYWAYWLDPRTGARSEAGRMCIGGKYDATGYQTSAASMLVASPRRVLQVENTSSWEQVHMEPPSRNPSATVAGSIAARNDAPNDWSLVIERVGAYPGLSF